MCVLGCSNRAFCYSKLELHKHVIRDCDKALQLEPTLLQAYILKGLSLQIFTDFLCVFVSRGLISLFLESEWW